MFSAFITPTPVRSFNRVFLYIQRPICSPVPSRSRKHSSFRMVGTESSSWRVVVTRRVPEAAMAMLHDAKPALDLDIWDSDEPMPHEELIKRLSTGADALYCMLTDKIDAEVLAAAGEQLKVVSTMSVGFNHIDIAECKKRGIKVGNTPEVLTETTADTALGLIMAACRRFKEASASVTEGTWGTWTPMGMCGMDVHHATVGVVGLGRIGFAVAKRLTGFSCKLLYYDAYPNPERAASIGATYAELDDLIKQADIIVTLLPLMKETTGIFNKDKFKMMKKTAVFVNPARGELVNQEDLYVALKEGWIFSAGLDVTVPEPLPTSNPLMHLPNCFILPHIGSASMATRTAMATLASQNLIAAYKGEPMPKGVC